MYFVLVASDDGFSVDKFNCKEDLEARLNEGWWGNAVEFAGQMPGNTDPNYWGNRAFIIKGSIVCPKIVETVTKVELP